MKDIIYKLPQEFIHKLKKIYPQRFSTVCESFTQKKISTFRINYLKTDLSNLRKCLQHQRVRFQELAFPAGVSAQAGYVRVWNESNDDWFDASENRFFASATLLW